MENKKQRSGVSLAIKKSMQNFRSGWPLIKNKSPSSFTIKVANTLKERAAAYHLGYKSYFEKGFIKANENQWLIQDYDANENTVVLIVQDQQKNIAGTVTLVFDNYSKLPAEKIYKEELNILRNQEGRIVEISRLVIDPQYRNAKEILVLLFNYLYIYAYFVENYNCLAIEVNPRHVAYYQELLHFRTIGAEKPCPLVKGAPAILMYVPLRHMQEEVVRLSKNVVDEKNNRSLYKYLLKPEQQRLVSHYLEKQTMPMSFEEKEYFGFTHSGFCKAVGL